MISDFINKFNIEIMSQYGPTLNIFFFFNCNTGKSIKTQQREHSANEQNYLTLVRIKDYTMWAVSNIDSCHYLVGLPTQILFQTETDLNWGKREKWKQIFDLHTNTLQKIYSTKKSLTSTTAAFSFYAQKILCFLIWYLDLWIS